MLTACELDTFSEIVSIGLPSSAHAELMESGNPARTGNHSLYLELTSKVHGTRRKRNTPGAPQSNDSATQGAIKWSEQTVKATQIRAESREAPVLPAICLHTQSSW